MHGLLTTLLSLWSLLVPPANAATALTSTQTSIVYGSDDCYAFDPDNRYVLTSDITFPVSAANDQLFGLQAATSGTGTVINGPFNNNNSTIQADSGATSGGYATITAQNNSTGIDGLAFGTARHCLKWRSSATSGSLVQRMEILGFGNSIINGTNYAAAGTSACVCFRIDVTTTNETLKAVAKNGASETVIDTGITQVLDTPITFEIVGTSTSATFFINGAAVATIGTNIPTAVLTPIFSSRTKENVAKATQVDWWKYSRPRS